MRTGTGTTRRADADGQLHHQPGLSNGAVPAANVTC